MLWRSHINVGPWLTEAIGLTCHRPSLQLLIVPGNPGSCFFYQKFIEHLDSTFKGSVNIVAVSHVGHDSANLTHGKVWCLDSQIKHKVCLLKDQLLGPGKPPVVVIAHSIGSHITLQAIRQLEEEVTHTRGGVGTATIRQQLIKVFLLTPFLATDWSSLRQRMLFMAAKLAPVLATAAGAVGLCPSWLQQLLVTALQPDAESHTWDSFKGLMGYHSVYNNFHLAQHEFRELDAPVDWQLIRRLGKRAAVVCAPQDMWFPVNHYQQMHRALPEMETYWRDELTHAFCLVARQCQVVAQLVHQSVISGLPEHIAQQLKAPGDSLAGAHQVHQQQGAYDGPCAHVEHGQSNHTQPPQHMVVEVIDDRSAEAATAECGT